MSRTMSESPASDGLVFSETMRGPFALGETDPVRGRRRAKDADAPSRCA
jgi:hypothetical protein